LIQAALESERPESALGLALTALKPGLPEAEEDALALGKLFEEAWSNFRIAPVVRLMELLKDQNVGDDVLKIVRKPLRAHFELAKRWSKTLEEMQAERFARDLRAFTRQQDF